MTTDLRRTLLRIVAEHDGAGWRKVASYLGAMDVPRHIDMMEALKGLADDGLLERRLGPTTDHWSLTERGREELSEEKNDKHA